MGSKEKGLINKALLEGTNKGRLFRGNAGKAYQGKIGFSGPGKIMLLNPRVFHGMPAGFPDVFGWETREIAKTCCGSCAIYKSCNLLYDKIYPAYKLGKGLLFVYEQLKKCFCDGQ